MLCLKSSKSSSSPSPKTSAPATSLTRPASPKTAAPPAISWRANRWSSPATEVLAVIYEMPRRRGASSNSAIATATALDEGDRIANVSGTARTLLECERVALNFLQRLSGVATLAHQFAAWSKARTAASSIPARPPPACAGSKRPPPPPAASPTTAWASSTQF